MSDGNFNRSMLPSNSYQSGVRRGNFKNESERRMEALRELLETHCVEIPGRKTKRNHHTF